MKRRISIERIDNWYLVRIETAPDLVEYQWGGWDECSANCVAQAIAARQ